MSESDKSVFKQLDAICDQYEQNWSDRRHLQLAEFVERVDKAKRDQLLALLLELDIELRQKKGLQIKSDDYSSLGPSAVSIAKEILHSDESKDSLPVQPLSNYASLATTSAKQTEGDEIGAYKLVKLLGEGGMGSVWKAKQEKPVSRHVALKLIRAGIGSKETIARFQSERQALAMMNHPNIASIYDAGTMAKGNPYFVMELVDGVPLTEYCDQNKLSINDRLKLFMDVCAGVQHAHQKGIIHRDLKPGNILVTTKDNRATPKVIDFGLAKAIDDAEQLTDQSLFTGIGQILGTLKYMSPEQAGMDQNTIDTRTDIYALGVILYELLTGTTPLDSSSIKDEAILKVLELIREQDPKRPSSKLGSSTNEQISTIVSKRQIEHTKLNRVLAGDLDWIVMKAIEKDPERRYASAAGFASDVERHLNNEPVVARPPSMSYRIGKYVQKHKVFVVTGILLMTSLIAGFIGTSWGMISANKARADAEFAEGEERKQRKSAEEQKKRADEAAERELKKAEQLEKIAAFQARRLQVIDLRKMGSGIAKDILAAVDESQREEANRILKSVNFADIALSTMRANVFDPALKAIDTDFDDQPIVKSTLLEFLAVTLRVLGVRDQAYELHTQSVALRRKNLGDEDQRTLDAVNNLALLLRLQGKFNEAEKLYLDSLPRWQKVLGEDHPYTIRCVNNISRLYLTKRDFKKAKPFAEQAWKLAEKYSPADDENRQLAANNYATLLEIEGQYEEAEKYYLVFLKDVTRVKGEFHSHTVTALNNLAMLFSRQGKKEKAIEYMSKVLDADRANFGSHHLYTIRSMSNLGNLYIQIGNLDEARQYVEEAEKESREHLEKNNPVRLDVTEGLGRFYLSTGQNEEGIRLFLEVVEQIEAIHGKNSLNLFSSLNGLVAANSNLKKFENANKLAHRALKICETHYGEKKHINTLLAIQNVGSTANEIDKLDEAEEYLIRAAGMVEEVEGDLSLRLQVFPALVSVLVKKQKFIEAQKYYDKQIELAKDLSDYRVQATCHYCEQLRKAGKFSTVLKILEPYAADNLGKEQSIARARILLSLGASRLGNKNFKDLATAESELIAAEKILAGQQKEKVRENLRETRSTLGDLYLAWHANEPGKGFDAKAKEWKKKADQSK